MGKRKRRLHSPKYAKKYASVRAAYAKLRGEVEEALVDGVVTEEEAAKIEKVVEEVKEAVEEAVKEVAEEETPKTKLKSKSRSAKFSSRKKTPDSSRGKRKPAKKK